MKRPSQIHCGWEHCSRVFGDAEQYRQHCVGHIQTDIAGARPQIILPAETWTEVLLSCGQKSLAQRISLTRRQFHAIARPLLDGPKERKLSEMAFVKLRQGNNVALVKHTANGGGLHSLVELPIAQVPPPQNVGNFSLIILKHFNTSVLSFLCAIRPLLNDIYLVVSAGTFYAQKWARSDQQRLYNWEHGMERHNLAALECLLRVFPRLELAITTLFICPRTTIISADMLARLLTNVRTLFIHCTMPAPESLSLSGIYCRHCSPYMPVLVEWLHNPNANCQQKMALLKIGNLDNLAALLAKAQEHFLCANPTPISYAVGLYSSLFKIANFEQPFRTLRNEHTKEVLSLRFFSDGPHFCADYPGNLVLCRRRGCESPSTGEQSEEAELDAMRREIYRASNVKEPLRNKLALNISQMDEFDESLFPADSEVEIANEADGNNRPGPSSAKKIKPENGE